MDPVEALHTAARRYARDRTADWVRRYEELLDRERQARREAGVPEPEAYGYSDEALATFPRSNVLRTISWALEELPLSKLGSLDHARERLAETGWSAESEHSRALDEISLRAMNEERSLFEDYVRSITEEELAATEPLRMGSRGPISSLGEELAPEIWALICWQASAGGAAVREWIVTTLDNAGVAHNELIPGVISIRLENSGDYDALRELLEDAGMDADDRGEWPEGGILHIPPFRHVTAP